MSWQFFTAVFYSRAKKIGDRLRWIKKGRISKTASTYNSKNFGRSYDGAPAESNSRCEPPPSECIGVRVVARRRRRCKKGRVSRDGPGGGADSALVHFCHASPRLPPRQRRRAGTPTVEPVRSRRGPPERDRGPGQYKPAGAPDQFVFFRHTANRRCPRRGRQSSLVIVNQLTRRCDDVVTAAKTIFEITFDCPRTKSGRAAADDDDNILSQ